MEVINFYNSIPPKFKCKNLIIGNFYLEENINPSVGHYYMKEDTFNFDLAYYLKIESYSYPPIQEMQSSSSEYIITYNDGENNVSIPVTNKLYDVTYSTTESYKKVIPH